MKAPAQCATMANRQNGLPALKKTLCGPLFNRPSGYDRPTEPWQAQPGTQIKRCPRILKSPFSMIIVASMWGVILVATDHLVDLIQPNDHFSRHIIVGPFAAHHGPPPLIGLLGNDVVANLDCHVEVFLFTG